MIATDNLYQPAPPAYHAEAIIDRYVGFHIMFPCIGIARGAGLSIYFAANQRKLVKPAPTTTLTIGVETLHVTSLLPDSRSLSVQINLLSKIAAASDLATEVGLNKKKAALFAISSDS